MIAINRRRKEKEKEENVNTINVTLHLTNARDKYLQIE